MKTSKCIRMGLCATSATLSVLGVEAKAVHSNCISPHDGMQESTSNESHKEQFHALETVIGSESAAADHSDELLLEQ